MSADKSALSSRPLKDAPLKGARRVVVKIGSALLIDPETGQARSDWMASVARDVAALKAGGTRVLIVSSGAVGLGRRAMGLKPGVLRLEEKQAAAAVGQPRLMSAWEAALATAGMIPAQALLTLDDTERRRRWLNARATLDTLLEHGLIPVINENDTVATEEIRYGDNDRLAARVAQMIGADVLVLLSDIDGLYEADPRSHPDARHVPVVTEISPEILAMAGGVNAAAGTGSGGMVTKLEAARIALIAGCATVIGAGQGLQPLDRLNAGERATWFLPSLTPETARRQWLAGSLRPEGTFHVDEGAGAALCAGNSLLPVGLKRVEGRFERGDAVAIVTVSGRRIGRGVTAYSAEDSLRLMGKHTDAIEAALGWKGRPALIHRDDLILD
jgi:glutamate 5-kinase